MPPAADTAAAAARKRAARASRARKKESRPTGLRKVPTVAMIVAPIAMVRWCGDHSCLAVFLLPTTYVALRASPHPGLSDLDVI